MRHAAFLTLLAAALAACAPLQTYYRPGASVADLNRETLACEVQALRDVPRSLVVERERPEFVPPRRSCDAKGACRVTRAGYWVPGRVIRYDPNDGLRRRVERQCMADKGYTPVSIPQCPDAVARAAPPGATTRLPVLRDGACVIRNPDGSAQIVNRG